MTPLPEYRYFVDAFPVVMYQAGKKNPEPIPLHVVMRNDGGGECSPVAFLYDRRDAKALAIHLTEREDVRRNPGFDG